MVCLPPAQRAGRSGFPSAWTRFTGALAAIAAVGALAGPGLAQDGPVTVGEFPSDTLRIMAPASAGGGWDGTARAVQQALQEDDIAAEPVTVFNRPGAGGTVGLAALINEESGDGHTVMMTGLTMVGSVILNQSPVELSQTTPIARLMGEYLAVVVGRDSEYTSIEQVLEDFTADPSSFVWGGGPGGGQDHTLVGFMARAAEVPISDLTYVGFSGGETRANIMGNQVSAGVTSYSEAKADAEGGLVRILAVSAPERLPGTDVPTLKEAGLDVELINWRGIVGPPDMPDDAREAWIEMLRRLQSSPTWQEIVETRGWTEAFLFGDEFEAFVQAESERVEALFNELGLIGDAEKPGG